MFTYEYRCRICGDVTERLRELEDRDNCPFCECGGRTRKIISLPKIHRDMRPYFDENLGCQINGKQHRQRVMNEQGVQEAHGQDWHTSAKKHRLDG